MSELDKRIVDSLETIILNRRVTDLHKKYIDNPKVILINPIDLKKNYVFIFKLALGAKLINRIPIVFNSRLIDTPVSMLELMSLI